MITNPHVLLHCSRKIADKRKRNQEVPALALGPARWNMPMDCINEMAPVTFKISFTELNKKPFNGIGAVFFCQICSILAANSGNQKICCFSNIYIYGKCLGFARTRNDDRRRIIIIIIRIKPLLKIFNECRSLTGVGELNPY